MDVPTLRATAKLLRESVTSLTADKQLDGLERLGADDVLTPLAWDLEISAPHFEERNQL